MILHKYYDVKDI